MVVYRFSLFFSLALIPRTHPPNPSPENFAQKRAQAEGVRRVQKSAFDIYTGYFKEVANLPSNSDFSVNLEPLCRQMSHIMCRTYFDFRDLQHSNFIDDRYMPLPGD